LVLCLYFTKRDFVRRKELSGLSDEKLEDAAEELIAGD